MPPKAPTVQWQIMVRQLPLLVLLFVVVLFWLGEELKDVLFAANLEIASRSNTAIVYAIHSSMLTEDTHGMWERTVEHLPKLEDTQIEIVGTDGTVVYSTDSTQRGLARHLSDPMCSACHEGGLREATLETVFVPDPADDRRRIFAAPLSNTMECRKCHSDDHNKLATILLSHDLSPVYRQVWTVQVTLAIIGGIALLATMLTTRLLLGRYLGRPLRRLTKGAMAIGAGDLGHTIELPEHTELSMLAHTLNRSSARLAEMIQRLKEQRDNTEVLYGLVDQLSRTILPVDRRKRAVELARKILNTDCAIIRAAFHGSNRAGDCTITFRGPDATVDRYISDDADGIPAPRFCSTELIERWLRGEFDDREEVREGATVIYPLHRHGQRLGLLIAGREDDVVPLEPARDPEMVGALCKRLAIALEFSSMQRELVQQERLAAIGDTVAGLAHWLKNTLNGLRAGQYVVDRALELNDEKKLLTGWQIMKKSVRQVETHTFDMLYYVRERVPKREPTNPNELMSDVIELLRESAVEQGVELRAELDESLGVAALDRTAIYRAVLNLVTNAIDACAESESDGIVVLRSLATAKEVVLTVKDNGIGMSAEVRKNLFTRFFTTKASKGTGLGISVVNKIAEEHGGTLVVESQVGKGSSFHIHLPRATTQGGECAPQRSP